jgi:hypothetical protein
MQRMNIGDAQYIERLAAGKIRCQRNCSILRIVPTEDCALCFLCFYNTELSHHTGKWILLCFLRTVHTTLLRSLILINSLRRFLYKYSSLHTEIGQKY